VSGRQGRCANYQILTAALTIRVNARPGELNDQRNPLTFLLMTAEFTP
jgi:hypothetical protein